MRNNDYRSIAIPFAPYLVIPDEVHDKEFLEYCSKHWEKTYVLGTEGQEFPNVHFLNTSQVDVGNDVTLLGCINHHENEQWLHEEIELCKKRRTNVVIMSKQFPLSTQEYLLRHPVSSWISGLNNRSMQEIDERSLVQMVVNPWNTPNYSNVRYIDIRKNARL
jgi:hypothetical protein